MTINWQFRVGDLAKLNASHNHYPVDENKKFIIYSYIAHSWIITDRQYSTSQQSRMTCKRE
jgi:hypothetical protein